MEDRGLRKKEEEDDTEENTTTITTTPTYYSTTPSGNSGGGGKSGSGGSGSGSAFKDKNKQPLCICPECDKKLTSLRGLFGHYGVKHRTQVNHDEITYACPFCVVDPNDKEVEFEVFESTEELVSLYIYIYMMLCWCCLFILIFY